MHVRILTAVAPLVNVKTNTNMSPAATVTECVVSLARVVDVRLYVVDSAVLVPF